MGRRRTNTPLIRDGEAEAKVNRLSMGSLLLILLAMLAGISCLRTGGAVARLRSAWQWLGFGCFAWAAMSLGDLALDRLTNEDPSWPMYLASAMLIAGGLRAAALVLRDRVRERDAVIDSALVGVIMGSLALELLVMPLIDHHGLRPAAAPVLWQLGLSIVLLISAAGLFWCKRRQSRIVYIALLAISAAPVIGAVLHAQLRDRMVTPESGLVALGLAIGFAGVAVVGQYAQIDRDDSIVRSAAGPANARRMFGIMAASVALQLIMRLHALWEPRVSYLVSATAVTIAALLVLRLKAAVQLASRLAERTTERNRLHAVVDFSTAIVGVPDMDSLLRQLGLATARAVESSYAVVTLHPPDGTRCVVTVDDPPLDTVGGTELFPLIKRRLSGLSPARVPFTMRVDDPWLPAEIAQRWRAHGKWDVLTLPITTEQDLIGYVEVWTPFTHATFPPDDVTTAAAVVQAGSLAIQNTRLLEQTRQSGHERALLLRVSQAAASSLELSTVLTEIAQATLAATAIEATTIELLDSESDELIVAALETIAAWPGGVSAGRRFAVDRWPMDRKALVGRSPLKYTVESADLPADVRDRLRSFGVGAALLFPLWSGDERIGLLKFFSRDPNAFGADEIRLGQEMSNQTALAIHHARLLQAEQQRANEWAILHRVSRAATSSLDLQTVLTEIAQASLDIPGTEACTIGLWDPSAPGIVIHADVGVPDWEGEPQIGFRIPETPLLSNRDALCSRGPFIIERDAPELSARELEQFDFYGIESVVAVPINRQDDEVGVLYLSSRRSGAFDLDVLRVGQEIAAQTALAIHNARLLADERQRANEWAVLHRVSRAAIAGLDKRTVLTDIAHACLGIAGTESCTIFSWDKANAEIVIEADVTIPDWPGVAEPGERFPLVPGAAEFRAMAERTPIIVRVDDPDLIEDDREVMNEHGMRSIVIIPVWISDADTGIIYLSSRNDAEFDDNVIRLGAEIAAQTALAIHNAQLLEESRRYADEQTALLHVSRAVSGGHVLTDVMNEVARASLAIAGAECCEVELLHAAADETEIVASQHLLAWDRGQSLIGTRLPLDDWPTTRRVIAARQPEVFDAETPAMTERERAVLFGREQNSALFVPIVSDDRCLGVMCYYARERSAFTEDSIRLGLDLGGQAALAIERARMQAALEEQANTDGLTGLLNHRAIQERLDEELARAHRTDDTVAVLMVDLNRFKYVNDTYGHQAGDIVLRAAATLLRSSVRPYDIVGRYGGDEFMIILPGAGAVEAISVGERIKESAAKTPLWGPVAGMSINLSVGLSVFPAQASTRQELIDVADREMYQAKHHRRRPAITGPQLLPTVAV